MNKKTIEKVEAIIRSYNKEAVDLHNEYRKDDIPFGAYERCKQLAASIAMDKLEDCLGLDDNYFDLSKGVSKD